MQIEDTKFKTVIDEISTLTLKPQTKWLQEIRNKCKKKKDRKLQKVIPHNTSIEKWKGIGNMTPQGGEKKNPILN